jgi:hypothetical protein
MSLVGMSLVRALAVLRFSGHFMAQSEPIAGLATGDENPLQSARAAERWPFLAQRPEPIGRPRYFHAEFRCNIDAPQRAASKL